MSRMKPFRKYLICAVVAVAAFVCVTSYGQYNKAYFFWMGRSHLIEAAIARPYASTTRC